MVVDGSSDGTVAMLEGLETPVPLRTIVQENAGQHVARNRGLESARGAVCLFLDDDILAEPDLVGEHMSLHRRHGPAVGIGRLSIRIPEGSDWVVRMNARSWEDHYAGLDTHGRKPSWMDAFGGNLSAPTSLLRRIGGFDPELRRSHDIELGYRLERAGAETIYVGSAIGHQDERKGFAELARDFEWAGAAWIEIYRRHPELLSPLLGSWHQERLAPRAVQSLAIRTGTPPRVVRALLTLAGMGNYRGFRFLRNYCYWRGIRRELGDGEEWRSLTAGTPILMYHGFAAPGEGSGRFLLPVEEFRTQLQALERMGYRVISLEEYLGYRAANRPPRPKSVVLTIDDGYRDFFDQALPELEEAGVPATLFVVSGHVGARNSWSPDGELDGRPLASREALMRLVGLQGMSVGAHTRTHRDLTTLAPGVAREEVEGSKAELTEWLASPVTTFAYPFGATSPEVIRLAEEAGFTGACGVEEGLNTVASPVHDLRRIEIFGTDSLLHFMLKVRLGLTYLPRIRPRTWRGAR